MNRSIDPKEMLPNRARQLLFPPLLQVCLLIAAIPAVPAAEPGSIVVFGDSTTAPRPGAVDKVYADHIATALRNAGSTTTVHNAGVPGNTTRDALARFDKDVLAHQPAVVVLMFGINDSAVDVWKNPPAAGPRVPLSEYEENLRNMIGTLRSHSIAPIFMTTNPLRWTARLKELYGKAPFAPEQEDGFDTPSLARYNAVLRRLARELGVPLVDVHRSFTANDPDTLLLDGMHPNDEGHALIARELLPVLERQLRLPDRE